ncbi:snake venom 5'-nucleotidase-like [Macrobrachium nipponense]|uniref:snake venom 5'-nucleotidase-like n=1 Tax=Macrobrachium nipponense TaxID=159736 RepID=UPI0030C7F565
MYLKLLSALLFALMCAKFASAQGSGDFELTILHLNDFHARFEETNVYSGRCTPGDKEKNRCYGGFARVHSIVSQLRQSIPNVLFLSGGDYYQGTVWYSILKWPALAHFLNIIQHDAMALGNHEFDDGISGVVPFLEKVTFPILGANIDDTKEPSIQGKYQKSVVVEKGGRKIGIVGYLTTETLVISSPGKLDITDEVKAVREEAKRLKSQGVDIIIALGHAGYRKDIMIAQEVGEVDVVVGGHTNTFLYTGKDPSTEMSVDQYPFIATQSSGKKVPVVQAYAYGKYIGRLDLTFNNAGEVTSWGGNPILLDNSIEQDPMVLEELVPWRQRVKEISREEIGKTYVFLDGQTLSCRMRECNMGNLETDAIVHQNVKYPDDMYWAHTALAVVNSGGIRSSIDERVSNGTITMDDIITIAPFRSTIDIVELRGIHVKQMFEYAVVNYDPKGLDPRGGFLQVSGFVVVYDINLPPGSRLVRLQARCAKCRVPELRDVVDDEVYKIAMPSFLASGGDGFSVIKDNKLNHHLTGLLDTAVYSDYVRTMSPIHQGLENRILFIDSNDLCPGMNTFTFPPHTNYTVDVTTNQPPHDRNAAQMRTGTTLMVMVIVTLVTGLLR